MNLRGISFTILVISGALFSSACSYSFFENSSSYPPGTTTADFPDYNHYAAVTAPSVRVPTEVALEVVGMLEDIFQVKRPGEIKCRDVVIFKKFVDLFFNTEDGQSPTLNYLCLFKGDAGEIKLTWQLSDHAGLSWPIVAPYNLIDTDLHILKSMDIYLNSSLSFAVGEEAAVMKLEGVTFNLSKSYLKGTSYSWIPEFFLSFEVDKIEIHNDGRYIVRLRLPLNIPLDIKGALELYLKNNALRFQGKNFYMQF